MKLNKLSNSFLYVGTFVVALATTSCDDFLTVLPTSQITEEDFWQDKNDLDNVRAGAYKKLTDLTNSVFYWGELRSDNVKLKDQSNTELLYLQQALLRPTNNNFGFSGFYTGINYCNKVLEHGAAMTNADPLVDPSFTKSDFRPIKAEMTALKALYYFYLVRAFRDVPYVSKSISTDAEAMKSKLPVTSGEAILGAMIDSLEVLKDYGIVNYGSTSENKGRFTYLSIRALLADMYLWRGCMLKNYSKKRDASGNIRALNLTDRIILDPVSGDTLGYKANDSTDVDDTYANDLALKCFQKAIEHSSFVIDDINKDFRDKIEKNPMSFNEREKDEKNIYPLYQHTQTTGTFLDDEVYSKIWARKNSRESIFELQFDGNNNKCGTYSTYMSTYSSSNLSAGLVVANDVLTSSLSTTGIDHKGFGRKDFRMLETICYEDEFISATTLPIIKNVLRQVVAEDISDMTEKASVANYRSSSDFDANWPIYRLSDVMLIKAEAIVRANQTADFGEANKLVNELFARNNPNMEAKDTTSTTAVNALLTKIYNERQREFVGEGKRWFDLVREAEAGNYYSSLSTSLMEDMSSFVAATNTVKNRMKNLWSFYCPFTESEMKVEGINSGGYLYQNPVWQRYSEK